MNEIKTYSSRIEIPENHHFLEGHFPGFKIYPGVAQLQDVCNLVAQQLGNPISVVRFSRVKFLALLKPPTAFDISVSVSNDSFSWEMTRGSEVTCKGHASFVMSSRANP